MNTWREHLFVQAVFQKAHAARDRGAGDRSSEMAQQTRSHARIVDDGYRLRFRLARIEARDRALAGAPADGFGVFEIGRMARAHAVVVALHASAFARNHRDADAVRCSTVVAEKTFTGSQSDFAAAKTRAATFRIR